MYFLAAILYFWLIWYFWSQKVMSTHTHTERFCFILNLIFFPKKQMLDLFSKFFCCRCYYFSLIKQVVQVHCGKKNLKRTNMKWKSTVFPNQNALQLHFGECVSERHSAMSNPLWTHGLLPIRLLCLWDFPCKNTGVGCHSLLQGLFLTQGSNLGFPHYRQILYQLGHLGSPHFGECHFKCFLSVCLCIYPPLYMHAHTLTHTHHKLWCIWWQVGEKSIEICWFKWWRGPSSRWHGFRAMTWGLGDVTEDLPMFCFSSVFHAISLIRDKCFPLWYQDGSQAWVRRDMYMTVSKERDWTLFQQFLSSKQWSIMTTHFQKTHSPISLCWEESLVHLRINQITRW